jgi:capsular exopolysaccharide synthesis family protein
MNDLRALPPAHDELFSSTPADHDSPFAIFGRLHRLLRGRYHIALPAAAVCGAAGAIAGYVAVTPKYQCIGSIRIQSVLPPKVVPSPENGILQMFQNYVRTQANYLEDDRTISTAVASPEWQALGRGLSPEAKDEFKRALDVVPDPNSQEWIRIKFKDADPKAARIAVDEIISAYIKIFGPDEVIIGEQLFSELRSSRAVVDTEIERLTAQVRAISQRWGTADLEKVHQDKIEELRQLEREVARLEMQIKQAETAAKLKAEQPAAPEADTDSINAQIASVDPSMANLLTILMQRRSDFTFASGRFGPEHLTYKRTKAALQAAQEEVDQHRVKWLAGHTLPAPGLGDIGLTVSPEQLPQLKILHDQYSAQLEEMKKRTLELSDDHMALKKLQDRIKDRQAFSSLIQARLDQLQTEAAPTEATSISQRIKIIRPSEDPYRPASDSRRKLAALGLLLGGGLPLGAFMLWGLMDRRYRYSDEAGTGRAAPTLLGILPYLPDQMNDPEQAAVAAHCVHQIRTLLQISGAHQDRRVFAITSPTAGDGKTSLSLSLGLSFAASGSETCLIDFDMIGGGLSSSMQAKGDLGLMDALEHGELNGHIRQTAFPRLSILPVGREDAQEVSRLSPELVQRIIDEARRRFDTVIIDTGPILGSIEASLVSAAADGVILTLGRGQSRTQAERAMSHLSHLGATLIGVVFNRADPGDFRRAVSSASVRSVPMQNGAMRPAVRSLPELGPMANTVAKNIGPEPEPGHEG